MDRAKRLQQLAALLHMAADAARQLAVGNNGASREMALATQVEGVALEFEALAQREIAGEPLP